MQSNFDSLETRSSGHYVLDETLSRIGWGNLSISNKVEKIKSIDFNEFKSLIIGLNGILLGKPEAERGIEDDGTIIKGWKYDVEYIDYISPSNSENLFEMFFNQMKKDISEDNIEQYGFKLRYAIDFAHLFEDGNGRTSRYAQNILVKNELYEKDDISSTQKKSQILFQQLNQLAVYDIYYSEIPEYFKSVMKDYVGIERLNLPESTKELYNKIGSSFVNNGYAAPLKVATLFKTMYDLSSDDRELYEEEKEMFGKNDEIYYNEVLQNPEFKKIYDFHYHILQEKLFWKVQELLDEELNEGINFQEISSKFKKRISELVYPHS